LLKRGQEHLKKTPANKANLAINRNKLYNSRS